MDDDYGHRWDDDRLVALLPGLLDDSESDGAEAATSAAPEDQLSLDDVVAAGRAASCWLDVVVTVRDVARHLGPVAGARPAASPDTSSAAPT